MARVEGRIVNGSRLHGRPREAGEALPFRILVLGDFSGDRAARTALAERRPVRVDLDSFEAAFSRLAPSLQLALGAESEPPIDVSFASIEDFEPDAVFSKVALFARMRELRRQLGDAATFRQAAAELQAPPSAPAAQASLAAEGDDALLERLLGRPAAGAGAAAPPASAAEAAVDRLLRSIMAAYVVPATAHLQQPLVAALDEAIAVSMRSLLRQPRWRALEGCWRAVDRFLRQVEIDAGVVVELFDVQASELLDDFVRTAGDPARSALGGIGAAERRGEDDDGWALIVGLHEFGPSAAELALLAALGALAADCGAVYVDSAAPALLDLAGRVEPAAAPRSGADTGADADAALRWTAIRESRVAAHVALVWPRVLSRLPYGAKTQPVESFAFEEMADGCSHERLAWRPAALDIAALLATAFTEAGWAMRPDEHLDIDDLPVWIDRSETPARMQAVAEIFLGERELRRVQAHGVMPLSSHRSLPKARLAGWQSIAADGAPPAGRWQGADRSDRGAG